MKKNKIDNTYCHRILASVLGFLLENGLSEKEIKITVEKILGEDRLKTSPRASTSKALGGNVDTVYAAVLHRWHREPALLDNNARPKALRLLGKFPSVESLIHSESPEGSAKVIAHSMKEAGLLAASRNGWYSPTSRVATVSAVHPMLTEHVAKSLVRYLETVRKNTSPDRRGPTLIERFTHIPDLNPSDASEFSSFAQSHGSAFLASVDDWLEGRRVIRSKNKLGKGGLAAGIHVFAYIDEKQKSSRPTRRAKRA